LQRFLKGTFHWYPPTVNTSDLILSSINDEKFLIFHAKVPSVGLLIIEIFSPLQAEYLTKTSAPNIAQPSTRYPLAESLKVLKGSKFEKPH